MIFQTYPYPETIANVICSDLDETFLPHNKAEIAESGISELEKFLLKQISENAVIFGLVTGSSLKATQRKIENYVTRFPHFIASSLGTELHWFVENERRESDAWIQNIKNSGYDKSKVDTILNRLKKEGIHLTLQSEDFQGKFKTSLYYHTGPNVEEDLTSITRCAAHYNIKTVYSRCNPLAGDPENCYDIDFIPQCAGKGEIVEFLQKELNIPRQRFYCFGDSFNDFPMFEKAAHSFLVANADNEAKKKHPYILEKKYSHGIKAKLEEFFP